LSSYDIFFSISQFRPDSRFAIVPRHGEIGLQVSSADKVRTGSAISRDDGYEQRAQFFERRYANVLHQNFLPLTLGFFESIWKLRSLLNISSSLAISFFFLNGIA